MHRRKCDDEALGYGFLGKTLKPMAWGGERSLIFRAGCTRRQMAARMLKWDFHATHRARRSLRRNAVRCKGEQGEKGRDGELGLKLQQPSRLGATRWILWGFATFESRFSGPGSSLSWDSNPRPAHYE